jgi:DNA polymerase-3 subunit delta'
MSEPSVIGFAGVRGHERVREFLRSAVTHAQLSHALLFAGPDGIGKRLVALALAAWLQCERRGDDACGTCTACRQVAAGSHPDLQLVAVAPGKKEIGVDRVRELKRFMQLRPLGGTSKVGIIDDAHLLTVAAQNALLKTLEEPADRSLLILVANNPDDLLATVRSRCQRVRFSPLPADTVADILIARYELTADVAGELALLSEGSPGRALALRGALTHTGGGRLREQLATLGTARYFDLMQLATTLRQPENEAALKLEMVLAAYRDDAARAIGAAVGGDLAGPASPAPTAVAAILRRADLVHQTWRAMRRGNPNRQLLLEALLLRLGRA